MRVITFISDRKKGILGALFIHFPNFLTRYCARHIFANFKFKFPKVILRNLYWKAARENEPRVFLCPIEQIKNISNNAYDWLQKIPAKQWSRHAFNVAIKIDHVTNYMTESFNYEAQCAKA